MPTLVELATQIVTAQTTASALSTDDIISSLTRIHATLGQLESNGNGTSAFTLTREVTEPAITVEKAFKKNEVVCLICGKSFRTLGSHLSCTHGITPYAYRKRFGIPKGQPLSAKAYAEGRKQNAAASVENMNKGKEAHARAARGEIAKAAREPVAGPRNAAVKAGGEETVTGPNRSDVGAKKKIGRPRKKKFTDYIVEV